MSDIRRFLDGRRFLTGSPFRCGYFFIASLIGLVALVIDVHLLFRYKDVLNVHATIILGILIGMQLIYQWWRALLYYSKIRQLYSMKSEEGSKEDTSVDLALRVAAGGLTEILFYCYGMMLITLVFVGVLLSHIPQGPK